MPSHSQFRPLAVRRACQLLVLSLCAGMAPGHAQLLPSQQPLLKKSGTGVAPNLFYTHDDSGSMGFTFAPETDAAWPGRVFNVNPRLHPNDTLMVRMSNNVNWSSCVMHAPALYSSAASGTNPATRSVRNAQGQLLISSLDQMSIRLRSPQFNRLFYNPEIRYLPWGTGIPSGMFANSTFTNARVDPRYIINASDSGALSTTINLSTPVDAVIGSQYWCGDNLGFMPRNINVTLTLEPSRYYLYNSDTKAFTSYTLAKDRNNINPPAQFTFNNAYPKRTDCTVSGTSTVCSLAAEQQNFANWFTYYRNRSLLARGATSLAFSDIANDIRVGYGQLNNGPDSSEGGVSNSTVVRGVRDFKVGTAVRTQFFNWLYRIDSAGGTPLRFAMDEVGKYFSITNASGPWSDAPGNGVLTNTTEVWGKQASCRRSYHVLMTDGYWNGAGASRSGDIDSTATTTTIAKNEDGRTYTYNPSFTNGINTSKSPYSDGFPNTLADVAKYYYITDLHPGLDNNIKVKFEAKDKTDISKPYYSVSEKIDRGDHAFWQHLTTYTVGLGVAGTIADTSTVPPSVKWPQPVENQATAVDDLFHAAVNGRGRYLAASDPQEFQDAIKSALNEIFQAQAADSGVSLASFEVTGNSLKFVPSFSQPDWTGDVKAYRLSDNQLMWSASTALPAASARNIEVWNGSGVEPFATSLSSGVRSLMGNPANANDLINFLRGERSLEGARYRCRGDLPGTKECKAGKDSNGNPTQTGLFGDVVNSVPLVVGDGIDMNYQLLPEGGGSYRDFVAKKVARTQSQRVVLVGANDGMLHMLRESNGQEIHAFIPQAVTPFLNRLANPSYGSTSSDDMLETTHHFFVDGRLNESDVLLGSTWTNVVVGSAGAGAKSVFALKFDASNPSNLSASPVMWEINALPGSNLPNADKLGHVMGSIAVGRMKNGKWVAIFGNGPGSSNGGAYLWIIDIATGQPLVSPIQAGNDTSNNGLGAVTVVRDATRTIVAAYAGDAKGRLWRFDLEGTSGWKTGFSNTPLFTPAVVAPVTAAPLFTAHPKGGLMVMYATGRLFTTADADDSSARHIYGVWDLTKPGSSSTGSVAASETQLVEHSVETTASVSSKMTAYAIKPSSTTITYSDAKGSRGWKIKMSATSAERVIYDPFLISSLAVFNSIAPSTTSAGDPCKSITSSSFLYLLNPLSGKMAPYNVVDTNGDGQVNAQDNAAGVISIAGDGGAIQPYRCKGKDCTKNDENSPGPCGSGQKGYNFASSKATVSTCLAAGYNVRTWQQLQNFPKEARQ